MLAVAVNTAWSVRLLLGCLSAGCAFGIFLWRSHLPKHDYDPATIEPAQSSTQRQLEVGEAATLLKISEGDLRFLTFMLLYPRLSRKRVNESIELDKPTIIKNAVMDLGIPDELIIGTKIAYVPVVRPVKGRLIRSLEVRDSQGNSLQTLNHEESVTLTARLADVLLRKAFELPDSGELPKDIGEVWAHFVATALIVPGRTTISSSVERQKFQDSVVRYLDELLGGSQAD